MDIKAIEDRLMDAALSIELNTFNVSTADHMLLLRQAADALQSATECAEQAEAALAQAKEQIAAFEAIEALDAEPERELTAEEVEEGKQVGRKLALRLMETYAPDLLAAAQAREASPFAESERLLAEVKRNLDADAAQARKVSPCDICGQPAGRHGTPGLDDHPYTVEAREVK